MRRWWCAVSVPWVLVGCNPFEDREVEETVVYDEDLIDGADPTGCEFGYRRSLPGGGHTLDGLVGHEDVFGEDPTPRNVHIGWPDRDTSNSISVVWLTDGEGSEERTHAALMQYGVGEIDDPAELTETKRGVSFAFGGPGNVLFQGHEVKMCGSLEPDTVYSYRVGGEGHWSPIHTFRTPPTPGTFDTYSVVFASDSRGAYETWGAMVAQMESFDPDFYVFPGDMVELGGNQREWEAWFAATGDTFARKVLVPSHGNHEFLAVNYFAQFSLPGNEEWFHIDFGNMSLISMNDTVNDPAKQNIDQARFIDQTLGRSTADWKVAMHHRPMFSTCTRHQSALDVRQAWATPLIDAGTDFVFAGHNHIYERSQSVSLTDNDQFTATTNLGDGTMYIVTGGAGAPLYRESDNSLFFADKANPTEHFVLGEFGPTGVTMTAYDLDGNVIDHFTVPK